MTVNETMTFTIALLDVTQPARAARLQPYLPAGFTITHGTEPGLEAMKGLIRDADFAAVAKVCERAAGLRIVAPATSGET